MQECGGVMEAFQLKVAVNLLGEYSFRLAKHAVKDTHGFYLEH